MSDKPSGNALVIADYVRERMAALGITQEDIRAILAANTTHDSKGYVQGRVSGKYSWSITELELIAGKLKCVDAFDLVAKAKRWRAKSDID